VAVKTSSPLIGRLRVLPGTHDGVAETGGGNGAASGAARGSPNKRGAARAAPDCAEQSSTTASAAGTAPSSDPAAEEAAREVFGSGHADDGPSNADGVFIRTRRWLAGRFSRA
jgi:hypothetical protein